MKKLVLAALLVVTLPTMLVGQGADGIRMEVIYQSGDVPGILIPPIAAEDSLLPLAETVRSIIRRDLNYSNQFALLTTSVPVSGDSVDYAAWSASGSRYVVLGRIDREAGRSFLKIRAYDVEKTERIANSSFVLPEPWDDRFRLAVHEISDKIVEWLTGVPGIAATRIVFVNKDGDKGDLYSIDFDGENLQRLTWDNSLALSPTWSPDGRSVAYTSFKNGAPYLYELEVSEGIDRVLSSREGAVLTPAYTPDGRRVAFAATEGFGTELFLKDVRAEGADIQITKSEASDALSPTFSPDGRYVAYVSNHSGEPHIYVRSASGNQLTQITSQSSYNQSPDWSPSGRHIAYHAEVGGSYHIFIATPDGERTVQITRQGNNEDPSWAPDGRHIVFSATRESGNGLYILDTETGRTRLLIGGKVALPDWSPRLSSR